jgi:cytochrome c peroxidase
VNPRADEIRDFPTGDLPHRGSFSQVFASYVAGPDARQATRAPYFHHGFAADLDAVVEFYDTRFGIGFSAQEKSDLVAFLRTL